jgi:hypothetical protein
MFFAIPIFWSTFWYMFSVTGLSVEEMYYITRLLSIKCNKRSFGIHSAEIGTWCWDSGVTQQTSQLLLANRRNASLTRHALAPRSSSARLRVWKRPARRQRVDPHLLSLPGKFGCPTASIALGDFILYSPANSLAQELASREWFRVLLYWTSLLACKNLHRSVEICFLKRYKNYIVLAVLSLLLFFRKNSKTCKSRKGEKLVPFIFLSEYSFSFTFHNTW